MIELSLKLNRVAYGAGEKVTMDKFSILTRGLLARHGVILSSGEDFGEDVLLLDGESHLLRSTRLHASLDLVFTVSGGVLASQQRSCSISAVFGQSHTLS